MSRSLKQKKYAAVIVHGNSAGVVWMSGLSKSLLNDGAQMFPVKLPGHSGERLRGDFFEESIRAIKSKIELAKEAGYEKIKIFAWSLGVNLVFQAYSDIKEDISDFILLETTPGAPIGRTEDGKAVVDGLLNLKGDLDRVEFSTLMRAIHNGSEPPEELWNDSVNTDSGVRDALMSLVVSGDLQDEGIILEGMNRCSNVIIILGADSAFQWMLPENIDVHLIPGAGHSIAFTHGDEILALV